MSDNYRSGQGSIIPTMFIGMGGVGSRIVDRIAAQAQRLPNWEAQLEPLTTFVTVDTNELDQHKLQRVPTGNRLNIAAFDKAKVIDGYRRSKNELILQWLNVGYQPRPGFKPGAGQIRVESRVGFAFYSSMIKKRLTEIVQGTLRPNITWRQSNPRKYYVYLFCSLAGGTGSGSFMSMAYLIASVIEEQHWQPRVIGNLLLSTLLLDKVGPELHGDIHANTYAALKEIEHMTKLDYKQEKQRGREVEPFVYCVDDTAREVTKVKTRPFFLSFLFDKPAHLSLPNVESAIADATYLQIFTPIVDNLASELDNYEKKIEQLTTFPGDLREVGHGYTKNFGAMGAVALVLPGRSLLEYATLRFAAEAVRSQITFGISPDVESDDRARALAKLAVNYSDPKFRSMGDEGRDQVIHQAFVDSVLEMGRQDERDNLTQGYWYELVQSVDLGRVVGTDEKGEPRRAESLLQAVTRKLGEQRTTLVNKVSIKDRAFVFHKEGLNQYIDLVARLLEDIRSARVIIDEGTKGLAASAREGEVITDLKLDPIGERYLVLRLLRIVETEWIPTAEGQREKAKLKDVSNPKVRERLEKDLYENMQQAAASRKLFGGDKAFLDAREEAQEYYRGVAMAARKMFLADIELSQMRALHEYLRNRARQYARLASRMEALVQDLEIEAERRRRGEGGDGLELSLRVEVFETLDEPRTRIWDRVYKSLYLDGGRYLTTFDRQTLATTIARELKPGTSPEGKVVEKSVEQTVRDVRAALIALGRQRLEPAIFGDDTDAGLDLARGLRLEATLLQKPRPGETEPRDEDIASYIEKKLRAVAQLAGVIARVDTAAFAALKDGVEPNRKRLLIVGAAGRGGKATNQFESEMVRVLQEGGRQVEIKPWHDPRLAIVHDVELPIPIYYVYPVTEEIERGYMNAASDTQRSYDLHTDYKWEQSLPNLNPRGSEIAVGWAVEMLARGLLLRVMKRDATSGQWLWDRPGGRAVSLESSLSAALYKLSDIHRHPDLSEALKKQMREAAERVTPDQVTARKKELEGAIEKIIFDIGHRRLEGEERRADLLDGPVWRVLLAEIKKGGPIEFDPEPSAGQDPFAALS